MGDAPTMRHATRVPRLHLWIPGLAVSSRASAMYQCNASGEVYLSRAARAWTAYVERIVTYEAVSAGFPICEALSGAAVTLVIRKAQGDADEYRELLLAGITAGLGVGEHVCQVASISREWRGNGSQAGVWVTVEAMAVSGKGAA